MLPYLRLPTVTMQPNMSRPVKPLEEKRSKWKLFSKSGNKSNDHLNSQVKAADRLSNGSGTTSDGVRGSIDASRPQVSGNGPAKTASVKEAPHQGHHHTTLQTSHQDSHHQLSGPSSGAGLDRGYRGVMNNTPPKQVHPGLVATQSGITMQKEFQPQSMLSSSSTPSVRQETYTDPVTGEIITKTITTVLTETTTTQVTRPPIPSPRDDELDLEEERRLATEYLAASELRLTSGLQPPPRSRGSIGQGNGRSSDPVNDISGVPITNPRLRRQSSGRRSPGSRASQHVPEPIVDHYASERYSLDKETNVSVSPPRTNHANHYSDYSSPEEHRGDRGRNFEPKYKVGKCHAS